jgi:uncharacterized protein involved in exopolysaccharide biosynthesis
MAEPADVFVYISYIRSNWRFVAVSFAVALGLAAFFSLISRREYTATARIIIEPPAGADPRGATAVSPVYLESLKTYEQLAASDSLFQKAAGRFQLAGLTGAKAIEGMKKRVLRVGLVRNTRILEIATTLPDPRRAQELAQYLAEETVSINRALAVRNGDELISQVEKQVQEARTLQDRDESEWAALTRSEPIEGLQAAISETVNLRAKLREQSANTRLEIADTGESQTQASPAEAEQLRKDQSNARTRLGEIENQIAAYDGQIARDESTLAQRQAHREDLDARRKADQAAVTSLESRLRDTRNEEGYRGERLSVIDPGVIPERPSSPNIRLNLLAAALLGLLFPVVYLAFSLNFQLHDAEARQDVVEALARARHG